MDVSFRKQGGSPQHDPRDAIRVDRRQAARKATRPVAALIAINAGGAAGSSAAIELDDATLADMAAWPLSTRHAGPAPLVAMALRPLPDIALAYYQAPASLTAITPGRSVSNDASAEIQAAIESVAN